MGEFCNGTFYRKLLKKMPEKMIMQYQQWVFDKEQKFFVIQEAGLQKASAEVYTGVEIRIRKIIYISAVKLR